MYYTAELMRDGDGYILTFPAFPEANTAGSTREEALENAKDALEVTILTYVKDDRPLPNDVAVEPSNRFQPITVSASVVAKLAFIEAFATAGITRVALAQRLGKGETEIRRMLDPYHKTKISTLEDGLRALGKRLIVTVEAA
jgi:antitoxin HicB